MFRSEGTRTNTEQKRQKKPYLITRSLIKISTLVLLILYFLVLKMISYKNLTKQLFYLTNDIDFGIKMVELYIKY
jgi:uncharacterized membrane protein (DUF485 family)